MLFRSHNISPKYIKFPPSQKRGRVILFSALIKGSHYYPNYLFFFFEDTTAPQITTATPAKQSPPAVPVAGFEEAALLADFEDVTAFDSTLEELSAVLSVPVLDETVSELVCEYSGFFSSSIAFSADSRTS